MKKTLFFLVILLNACSGMEKDRVVRTRQTQMFSLYEKGKQESNSYQERLGYLNQALALSKENDSIISYLLYSKCNVHFNLKQYDSLYKYGKNLQPPVGYSFEHYNLGRYYHLLAYYHETKTSNIDSAFYYQNLAKSQFLIIKDSSLIGRRLVRIGYLQKLRGDIFGSKETLTEALSYINSKKDINYLANLYNELGSTNGALENYSEAIEYYRKAIETSKSGKDILIYKNNLGVYLTRNEQYNKALEIFREISLDPTLLKDTLDYARVGHNYTYAKWRHGYSILESDFYRALSLRKIKNDKHGQISSYTDIGEYFSKTSPKKALKYLDTAIQLSRELKMPKAETNALYFLMALEPKNTSFKDRYIFLKDSLYSQELKVKTQFAKMKYDDKLEKEKIITLETEATQKRADLAEQKVQKILSWSLSGLLLIVAGLLHFFIRQRYRKEKLKEVYETEKRISQKVHDELANDIYGVMANVQHDPNLDTDKMLDSLERIYKRTRNISHETGEVETDNFHEVLKKLLSSYQSEKTSITVKDLDPNLWNTILDHKKVVVYRVLNELMVNMSKHSEASLVVLHFKQKNKSLEIRYNDNGKGFEQNQNYGIGLRNTGNRIRSIGGTLSLDLEYLKGARITITFPN